MTSLSLLRTAIGCGVTPCCASTTVRRSTIVGMSTWFGLGHRQCSSHMPRVCQIAAVSCARMPKRPPRAVRELPVPEDLRATGPTRALASGGGELWHADVIDLLARLPDRSVDLVVTDQIGRASCRERV